MITAEDTPNKPTDPEMMEELENAVDFQTEQEILESRMPLVNRHFRRAHKKCQLCGGLAIVRKPIEGGQWVLAACPEPR